MKPNIIVALALAGAALSGCVQNYAEREIVQGREAAIVTVANAPADARVLVDGRDMGAVSQINVGLALTSGRHEIAIVRDGVQLHQQAVFAAAGAQVEVRIP